MRHSSSTLSVEETNRESVFEYVLRFEGLQNARYEILQYPLPEDTSGSSRWRLMLNNIMATALAVAFFF